MHKRNCWLRCLITLVVWMSMTAIAPGDDASSIVISQLYGGGGNSGSKLRNDFVELFNRGNSTVNVSGWSLQYASASGNSWDRTALSGTIEPGRYYLIQEDQGSGGSLSLPSPDAVGAINLSAISGKLALVSNSNLLTTSAPTGPAIVDFVGYGAVNFSEGRPTDALTNTTAVIRRGNGCNDSNNNQSDFSIGEPNPRNSRSPASPCTPSTPTAPTLPSPPSLPSSPNPPSPALPQITVGGMRNAASRVGGTIAPGEFIVLSGSNFGPSSRVPLALMPDGQHASISLGGVRVLFDGAAAPLVYADMNEASAVVPFELDGRSGTSIQVEYNGIASNPVTVPVAASAPGIFTVDSSGQTSVINADGTPNGISSPAQQGSVVTINATGGGQSVPQGDDGRIIGDDIPKLLLPVRVLIAGTDAHVLDAGGVTGMISGLIQIKAVVPNDLVGGGSVPLTVVIGGLSSQSGITIAIAPPQAPIGSSIDDKLQQLKTDPTLSFLPDLPTDNSTIPSDWLALVSWNTQIGGTSVVPGAPRPPMVQSALASLFSGTYQLLAAQEVPSSDSASLLQMLLPGGTTTWQTSFFDTTDTMDNGFWYRNGITLRDSFPLFVTDQKDSSGRIIADSSESVHPPQVAQFEIGDFDFTLITLHLTFANGDTAESVRELREILDYLDWYFNQPDHDPDVIVCGDFNTPSLLSLQTGKDGITLDSVFDQDPRFQVGERRFAVTIHEPTSRNSAAKGGLPVSNYDHCVVSVSTMKEFIQARRVAINILTDNPDDPEVRLTSDHFPIVAFFKIHGPGITLDRKTRIRP